MKFKVPPFLENIEDPIAGELALRTNYPGSCIIGIDEVGRGPLAGPVIACAAILQNPRGNAALNDSKKLSRKKREFLFDQIKEECLCYAIASASAAEIDTYNILEADFLAMRRALCALGFPGLETSAPEIPIESKGKLPSNAKILVAVDGNLKIRGVPQESQIAVIKGDARVASISAASILAKVYRDRHMNSLAQNIPDTLSKKMPVTEPKRISTESACLDYPPNTEKVFTPKVSKPIYSKPAKTRPVKVFQS